MCSHGKRARLGALGVGWVRMLRAVKDDQATLENEVGNWDDAHSRGALSHLL